MADDQSRGVPSTASIFGHPLHPMIVPFPIAFLVGALASDIMFVSTGEIYWAYGSKWLIVAALVTAVMAAILGLTDFLTIRRVRTHWTGWVHMGGNIVAVLLSLISLLDRWDDPAAAVRSVGLPISIAVVVIVVFTGWLGGELVYRYKIGVMESPIDPQTRKRGLSGPYPAE